MSASTVTPDVSVDVFEVVKHGAVIVGNKQLLKERVLEEIEKGATKIQLDVSNIAYADSSGWGAMRSLVDKVRAKNGVIILKGLNEDMRTFLELTKLDTAFILVD